MILLIEAGGMRSSAPLSRSTATVSKSTMIACLAAVSMLASAAHPGLAQGIMARNDTARKRRSEGFFMRGLMILGEREKGGSITSMSKDYAGIMKNWARFVNFLINNNLGVAIPPRRHLV